MRVVGGSLGGRTLRAPRGRAVRPTSDRVREALFAILGDVGGARTLDLFAGSGALAIEALSRGAQSAVLVERDRAAAAAAAANLGALGIAENVATLVRADAFAALRSASARGAAYDLVFLDPPYRDAPRLGRELSAALAPVLAPGARVVVESDRRSPLELTAPVMTDERRYGDTLIRIHTNGP
jgi:16S rRNA (guanine966-N2)-methyltransferase